MLSPMDDYLIHQAAETLDHPATSDTNFYDRYYFSAFSPESGAFIAVAFGQYPNLNVTDAFANAVLGERQYIVRGSRELNGDRGKTAAGPVRVEVLEGLSRLRVVCEPNDWGLSFDLTFEARSAPHEEPRFYRRAGPRVVQDYIRFTQTGRWSGTALIGDRSSLWSRGRGTGRATAPGGCGPWASRARAARHSHAGPSTGTGRPCSSRTARCCSP